MADPALGKPSVGQKLGGFFGGALDPPHVGHLIAVTYALSVGGLDHVWVAPTANHPRKQVRTSLGHRFQMCELLFKHLDVGACHVCNFEEALAAKHPDTPVYTIETIKHIFGSWQAQQVLEHGVAPNARLIVGSDEAETLHTWHQADELLRIAPPLVVPRYLNHNYLQRDTDRLHGPSTDVSSSLIRLQLSGVQHCPSELKTMLPPDIIDYIFEHGLYGVRR